MLKAFMHHNGNVRKHSDLDAKPLKSCAIYTMNSAEPRIEYHGTPKFLKVSHAGAHTECFQMPLSHQTTR